MPLDAREIAKLQRIIAISQKLIAFSPKPKRGRPASKTGNGVLKLTRKRTRRTGEELVKFRNKIKAELKKGISVAAIAKKHKITTSYIYQL